nr:MAG TPA: YopX protein [Caudoviricetes sp.]
MTPRFRAWDKHNQNMFANDELIIWNNNVYANDSKKLSCNYLKGWSIDEEYLMQSTGLFDENGVEIFEGDIIAIEVDDTEAPINAKIFQNSKIGMLMFHVFEDNEDVPMVELLEDNSVAFAVIGNIYENPELLEVEE